MAEITRFEENWEFCFDPSLAGLENQWYRQKPSVPLKKIHTPHLFAHESNPENAFVGFYFREFTLNLKEAAKRFLLRVHSAHPFCQVWLNGEELGSRFPGHVSFDLEATKPLKATGTNLLVIRVQSLDKQGKIQDQPAVELPLGAPFQKGSYAGLLGPVDLIPGGKAIIRSVNVLPDFEADRITIETRFLNNKSFQSEATFDITQSRRRNRNFGEEHPPRQGKTASMP